MNQIFDYISQKGKPFSLEETKSVVNIVTGKHFADDEINYKFQCLPFGSQAYATFVEKRFKVKSKQLMDKIPHNQKTHVQRKKSKEKDVRKETTQICKSIDIARHVFASLMHHYYTWYSLGLKDASFISVGGNTICGGNTSNGY